MPKKPGTKSKNPSDAPTQIEVNSRREVYSSKFYIIQWLPKEKDIRAVSGAFINGHFDKVRVLDGPYQHLPNAQRALVEHREEYEDMIN